MTWTNHVRNQIITGASDAARCRKAAFYLKQALVAAGWTVKGSGTGTGGAGAWDDADRWTVDPPYDLAWIGLQNADGCQILLQCNTYRLYMARYVGSYVGTGADADTWPDRGAPPASEYIHQNSGYSYWGVSTDYYLNVTTSDDHNSFIAWTSSGGVVFAVAFVLKLTDLKTGDTEPYFSYRCGQSAGNQVFTTSYLRSLSSANRAVARHPAGNKSYFLPDLACDTTFPMASMTGDPVSGKEQLHELLAVCVDTSYYNIKGRVPGIYRCSSLRSIADTFNTGDLVCVGSYAVPWGSAVTPMM